MLIAKNHSRGVLELVRQWTGVLVCFLVLVSSGAVSAGVLIINSGHQGSLTTDALMRGIRTTLAAQERPPVYWVEYLDELRFPQAEHQRAFSEALERKYEQADVDVVLVTGNAAFRFVRQNRALFEEVPLVFAAVDKRQLGGLKPTDNATGVVSSNGLSRTLDLALALQPSAERIVYVVPTPSNRKPLSSDELSGNEELTVVSIDAPNLVDITRQLQSYGLETIVVPLSAPRADERRKMRMDTFVDALARASSAPIYGVADYLLGRGIVGGSLASGAAQGRRAANMMLDVVRGAPIAEIEFAESTPALTVDHERLLRVGLNPNRIPPNAIVVNRPRGFLAEHLEVVLGTGFAILLLFGISVALLGSVMRGRRIAQALRDSEEKYRQIFSTESDAIILFDADDLQILDANDAALSMYGYRRAELLSMKAVQLSSEPMKSVELLDRVRKQRFASAAFRLHHTHSGADIPVEISMSAFELKGKDVIVAVVRDISERLTAENALRDSEQRFRDFANSASDWYWEMDAQLRFSGFSERMLEMTGVAPENLLGKTREETGIPGLSTEEFRRHLDDLRAHRSFRNFVHPRIKPNGETVYLSINGRPVFDDNGQFQGYRGTGTDITEHKRAEDELNRIRYNLEELVSARTAALKTSNRELESFSYSVSHDLRSPLRSIDGFSNLLMDDYGSQLDERAHDYLDRIRRAAQRMGRLIDDLLELSRLTRSKLRRQSVDLSSLAEQINARLKEAHPERSVDTIIQNEMVCVGDAHLLRVALENLFDNAWKYTSKKPRGHIEFGMREAHGQQIFFVRDNGVGFDMRFVHKLFGEFQRLHADGEFSGTGIGLATVARVVRRHGGEIWAEGKVDEGATFSFSLNSRPAQSESPEIVQALNENTAAPVPDTAPNESDRTS